MLAARMPVYCSSGPQRPYCTSRVPRDRPVDNLTDSLWREWEGIRLMTDPASADLFWPWLLLTDSRTSFTVQSYLIIDIPCCWQTAAGQHVHLGPGVGPLWSKYTLGVNNNWRLGYWHQENEPSDRPWWIAKDRCVCTFPSLSSSAVSHIIHVPWATTNISIDFYK